MTERSNVREFFRTGKVASVNDVAQHFKCSYTTAGNHVRALRMAGEIELVDARDPSRRGPVAAVYRAAARLLPEVQSGGIVDKAIASQPLLAYVWHPMRTHQETHA